MPEQQSKRRLAAILAADVVGYSRLLGDDEAGTLARLRALRAEIIDPLMAEHAGRVFKTAGDRTKHCCRRCDPIFVPATVSRRSATRTTWPSGVTLF